MKSPCAGLHIGTQIGVIKGLNNKSVKIIDIIFFLDSMFQNMNFGF